MLWLRLSGWLFVLILLATAAIMLLGSRLPPNQTTTIVAILPAQPDRLWPLLTDPAAQPHWRSDVTATDPLPDTNCWLEHHDRTQIPVCITARDQTHLTLQSADPRLPFHGERRFTLAPSFSSTTRLTVTETIAITPPMVRFYDHYISTQQTRLDRLLADLTQAVTPPPNPATATP